MSELVIRGFYDPHGKLRRLVTSHGGGNSSDARVVVSRTGEADCRLRELYVEIDGERLSRLEYGQSIACELPIGRHVLKVTNTLNSRQAVIEAVPGKTLRFQAGNRAGGCGLLMFFALGVGPVWSFLEQVDMA